MSEHDDYRTVHAIDTETTGLDPEIDRVRQIGIASGNLVTGITSKISILVDTCGVASSPRALAVHQIPDNMPGGISLAEAIERAAEIIGEDELIAQNAAFDLSMIRTNLRRDNAPIPAFLDRPVTDTMDLARARFPRERLNLDRLIDLTGLKNRVESSRDKRHDAAEDAALTLLVWRALRSRNALFEENAATGTATNRADTTPADDGQVAATTIDWL